MIKKILFIFSLFFICNVVYAEKFSVGDYISGEYIKMVSDTTSKYLTIQKILDSNGNIVYCIEPFILVDQETKEYTTYVKDLTGYNGLNEAQKRKVSLIAYYGYGYGNRMTEKWYAITQMLIWKTVDPDSDFYFTDTSNGNKISKYTSEMSSILSDVYYHDEVPTFIKDYNVNYMEDLVITNYDDVYTVESTYDYVYDSSKATLTVSNVEDNGTFVFERDAKRYLWDTVIFDNDDSQDLIRPGRVVNQLYTINVSVNSGDITLDIRKDESNTYTKESDFSNTCYEISNNVEVIDKVCTSNDNLIYKTDKLPYGEYSVKQVSVGTGYEIDNNEYNVVVDGSDNTLILNNNLIKNKIELVKYYCINDNCLYEENARFNVYDKDNNLVGSITTNGDGYGYLEVGYGTYTVIQEYGLDNYTFVDEYTLDIINSSDEHYKELYNYYIEEVVGDYGTLEPDDTEIKEEEDTVKEEEEVIEEKQEETNKEEEIIDDNKQEDKVEDDTVEIIDPPYTGTKLAEILKILYNVIMIVICYCNLKRFCYNN